MAAIMFKSEPGICNCGGSRLVVDGNLLVCATVRDVIDGCVIVLKLSDPAMAEVTIAFFDKIAAEQKFNEIIAAINNK